MFPTICYLKKVMGDPGKELKDWILKHSFSDIFRTVDNSQTFVEQNVLVFTGPFIDIKKKGMAPHSNGEEGSKVFFIITLS